MLEEVSESLSLQLNVLTQTKIKSKLLSAMDRVIQEPPTILSMSYGQVTEFTMKCAKRLSVERTKQDLI